MAVGDFLKKTRLYIFLMSFMLVVWDMYVFRPVSAVSMFIHKIGHNFVAFLFDRSFAVFSITLDKSVYSNRFANSWFSSFVIANSGYVVSLLFAILMLRVKDKRVSRYILGFMSSLILVSLVYMKNNETSFLHLIIFLIIMILLHMLDNDKIFEYAADIIGVSSIVYCVHETLVKDILPVVVNRVGILKDVVAYSKTTTDSEVLCNITGIPVVIWGIFWFLVSLFVMVFCMNTKKIGKY